jgi:CRP-like cAMP-binding protein
MDRDALIDALSSFTLFADLSRPELEGMVHTFEEEWFAAGQTVVHQGFTGTGFYVILEGDASVRIDGEERAKLARGDFFGELSVLLDEPPVADVVALTPMRALVLARDALDEVLLQHPQVCLRMLQGTLRRLRSASRWRP